MIEVDKVTKMYGPVKALEDVSFQIQQGEIVGLLGPNGAGKTTLLKVLTGFFEPTGGKVLVDGTDVVEDPIEVRRLIGYLPENAPLYPEMLVQESLVMAADLRGLSGSDRTQKLKRSIEATGLQKVLTRPISELSKGFRQRVGLAQAIMHQPKILILDEPTNGLDPEQIIEVRNLIRELARHSTVILSTHILTEVEQSCERVVVLVAGSLRADAKMEDLKATNCFRASFVSSIDTDQIRASLASADGVTAVRPLEAQNGLVSVVVEAATDVDLGALVFEMSKTQNLPLRELRPDIRSLESVFLQALSSEREVQV